MTTKPTGTIDYTPATTAQITKTTGSFAIDERQDSSGALKTMLVATLSGVETVYDISDVIADAREGSAFKGMNGYPMTRLAASYTPVDGSPATLSFDVEDTGTTGGNIEAGDFILIMSEIGASTWDIAPVASLGGSPRINVTLDLVGGSHPVSNNYNQGALVFNISKGLPSRARTSRGLNKRSGWRNRLEAPSGLVVGVSPQTTPAAVIVTLTPNSSWKVPVFYQIFVRDAQFAAIEPHWVADKVTNDDSASHTITTYDGGADAGGGSISGGNTYYVAVAATADQDGTMSATDPAASFFDPDSITTESVDV